MKKVSQNLFNHSLNSCALDRMSTSYFLGAHIFGGHLKEEWSGECPGPPFPQSYSITNMPQCPKIPAEWMNVCGGESKQ